MKQDPIVDEIRKNRAKLAKRFKGNIRAIIKDAQRRQRSSKRHLVSFADDAKKVAA